MINVTCREVVVVQSHDGEYFHELQDISQREFAEEQARGHSAKGRDLKSPRNRGWESTRVYLIARSNLMSRTKCT